MPFALVGHAWIATNIKANDKTSMAKKLNGHNFEDGIVPSPAQDGDGKVGGHRATQAVHLRENFKSSLDGKPGLLIGCDADRCSFEQVERHGERIARL